MGVDYYETIEEIEQAQSHGLPTVGIGHRCYIRNAIVDKNCRIGDDVRINGGHHLENSDHSLYTVKGRRGRDQERRRPAKRICHLTIAGMPKSKYPRLHRGRWPIPNPCSQPGRSFP
jgi:hypothetical protein